jgi:hypothetical protein
MAMLHQAATCMASMMLPSGCEARLSRMANFIAALLITRPTVMKGLQLHHHGVQWHQAIAWTGILIGTSLQINLCAQ